MISRVVVDLKTSVAIIEASNEGEPYVTLLRDDDGAANSFVLDGPRDDLELFALAILQSIEEAKNGVDNGKEVE